MIVIGMDIGHCETTSVIITQVEGKNEAKSLQMDGNHNMVITSQITLSSEQMYKIQGQELTKELLDSLGDIRIGAHVQYNPKDGEYFIYFKCPPEKFDDLYGTTHAAKDTGLSRGNLMALFTYQAFKNVMKNNNELAERDLSEILLMVGCPTTEKWTDQENLDAYARLIQSVTRVSKVVIIPESRAAMFSSVEKGSSRFSAADGVLVFDFGSSTADCTYMLLGRKIMEFSWSLGASMVEEQMMWTAYERCKIMYGDSAKKLQLMSPATAQMLSILRKAKEEYYRGIESKVVCTFMDTAGTEFDILLKVDEGLMETAVCGRQSQCECDSKSVITGSWQSLCKRFYEEARRTLTQEGLPCKTVILTGGASRMDFIGSLCKEVFRDELSQGTKVFQDHNPSYSVSTGLGWVGTADERYGKCLEEAAADMKSSSLGSFESLEAAVSLQLQEPVFNTIKKCSKKWANSLTDRSVEDLQNMIQNELAGEGGRNEINQKLQSAIDVWRGEFKTGIQTVVNKQAELLFSQEVAQGLIISDHVWENLNAADLDISIDVKKVLGSLELGGKLNKILSNVVMYAVAIAVMAMLSMVPVLNVIAGIIAGAIAGALVTDEDMRKIRTKKEREQIDAQMDKVLKGKDIVEGFEKNVKEAMADCREDSDRVTENTLKCAFDIITLRRFSI